MEELRRACEKGMDGDWENEGGGGEGSKGGGGDADANEAYERKRLRTA